MRVVKQSWPFLLVGVLCLIAVGLKGCTALFPAQERARTASRQEQLQRRMVHYDSVRVALMERQTIALEKIANDAY